MVSFTLIPTNDSVADQLVARWATPEDHAEAAKRGLQGRGRSLLARAGLRALLNRRIAAATWVLHTDARGKLFAKSEAGLPGPHVCLSHTRDVVACAVGDVNPVGIDVEAHRPRAWSAVAEYAFGPHENALVRQGGAGAFYRVWTLREAMGKATGEGLSLATDGRDRAHGGPAEGCWTSSAGDARWLLAHQCPAPGLSLAVAVQTLVDMEWVDEPLERINPDALS